MGREVRLLQGAGQTKEMERHTTIGHEILANSESELLRIAATIALTHHEEALSLRG